MTVSWLYAVVLLSAVVHKTKLSSGIFSIFESAMPQVAAL